MPKFKFSADFSLARVLANMGMPDAFDPSNADFSGMDGKQDLHISEVIHKAFVAADENGTEAAAASAVNIGPGTAAPPPPHPIHMTLDHPFFFVIRDDATGTILFVGRVMNPNG